MVGSHFIHTETYTRTHMHSMRSIACAAFWCIDTAAAKRHTETSLPSVPSRYAHQAQRSGASIQGQPNTGKRCTETSLLGLPSLFACQAKRSGASNRDQPNARDLTPQPALANAYHAPRSGASRGKPNAAKRHTETLVKHPMVQCCSDGAQASYGNAKLLSE